jgi:hypothetical protein
MDYFDSADAIREQQDLIREHKRGYEVKEGYELAVSILCLAVVVAAIWVCR